MEKEVYKKDKVAPDDLSSWFICKRMDGGELLLTLKNEVKERTDFHNMLLGSPIFDHGFTAFRIMRRHGNLDWITFINETRREKSQTFNNGQHRTYKDEWEARNIEIVLGVVDEIINEF